MAVQTQSSDSLFHPSGFMRDKDDEDDDRGYFHLEGMSEPFDEAVVPESPLMEDTLVMDYSDCDDTKIGGGGLEEEVVLDSEDEVVNGSRLVTIGDMGGLDRTCAAGLSYADSQEPGEDSQANALGFVDQFLSLNVDLGLNSPETDTRKTTMVKSPPVTSTKGTQALARMVELQSHNAEANAFEWVDLPDDRPLCFSDKKRELSLVNPKGKRRSENVSRNKKIKHANYLKCISSSSDGNKETSIIRNLNKDIAKSEGKSGNRSANAPEDHLNEKPTEPPLEPSEEGGDAVDMFDVGFNTQIAAEAMEALSYGGHPVNNTVDVGSGGATENIAYVGGRSKNANQRNCSARIPRKAGASSQRPSKMQELSPDIAAAQKVRKSSSSKANNNLCTESPNSIKKRKLQSAIDYSQGGSGPLQTTDLMLVGTSRRMEDGLNKEIVTYRRKKRSLDSISPETISSYEVGSDEPLKQNNVKKQDIVTYRRKKRGAAKKNSVQVSLEENTSSKACSLQLGLQSHPKGKRTSRHARKDSCRATASSNPCRLLDKDSSPFDERPERSKNMARKEQSSFSRNHKKQRDKNLPKSSIKKELIGLGVSESVPDITWKDLRRQRSTVYVRVLFSQHLDGDIIKQQKKIIARLGLSLASCSMDATHFVADQFARTRNMLEFIALGKPVVTHLWLESCGEANCLISEKSYILRDAKKEKEIGYNMIVSLESAKRCPLLKDRKVFITPSIKPGKEMMISLVKTAQGMPVEKAQISTARRKEILDELLILSCQEDEAICLPFLEKGVAVYDSELLLSGIVTQRLQYNRHQLFTDVKQLRL